MNTSVALLLTDILPNKRGFVNKVVKSKLFDNHTHDLVFAKLRKSGIDGIEILIPKIISMEDVKDAKKLLNKNKIKVFSVHQSLRFLSITGLAEITTLFDIAKVVGAKVIVLHMNTVGKQIFDKNYIGKLHALEKKYKVKIGFENREKYLGSALNGYGWDEVKFPALMKKTGFAITLDVCHLGQAGGDIVRFFKNNKKNIVNIHLSDYKPHYLNSSLRPLRYKHLPLGKGNLPIEEFIKTVKKANFTGLMTLEINAPLEALLESAILVKKTT